MSTHADRLVSTVEREYKLSCADDIALEQARALLAPWAAARRRRRQRNAYYDTAGLELTRARTMVRLRQDGDRWLVTCKQAPSLRDGMMVVAEHEATWPTPPGNSPPEVLAWRQSPLAALLEPVLREGLDQAPLRLLGLLDNDRESLQLPRSLLGGTSERLVVVDLDHSTCAAGERFELELEDEDAGALGPALAVWLLDRGVATEPTTCSKFRWMLGAVAPAFAATPALAARDDDG